MTGPKTAQEALEIAYRGIEANAARQSYFSRDRLTKDQMRSIIAQRYADMWPDLIKLDDAGRLVAK